MLRAPCLMALALSSPIAHAQTAPPDPAALVAENTHSFSYTDTKLEGPGAAFLLGQTARSQFVLLGEQHMDHAIPVFAGALYQMLHEQHGFRHVVVEQDPVAIDEALMPPRRADVQALAKHARRYPSLFEFDTDEDLAFLAFASSLEPGPDAIWGAEQTTGAIRYLEDLVELAPNDRAREKAKETLAAAKAADPGPRYTVHWLASAEAPPAIESLERAFGAAPGSRAAWLLSSLAKSAEVFGYYRRAEAGEFVGLYNNTVREEVLKSNFLARYRAVARNGAHPKALFKFGANHLYRGKNPTQAFPIGNLAHELAIVNGMEAYGMYVMMLGDNYASYADYPAWLHPLLPKTEPQSPVVVDLRPLRRFQRLFRQQVEVSRQWELLCVLHGYDAIVILPGSKPASRNLGN